MDMHKNARTTPHSRAVIAHRVAAGARPAAVAQTFGVCERTVRKWAARAAEGPVALEDRSCRPHHSPRAISSGLVVEIQRLQQRRWTGAVIAEAIGLSRATVARTLRQLGLARLAALDSPAPGRRYEWAEPGQLVHLDIKKLGRIGRSGIESPATAAPACGASAGSSCTSASTMLPRRLRRGAAGRAERHRRRVSAARAPVVRPARRARPAHPHRQRRAYRSRLLAALCRARQLRQRFTRPYTPRTNGKAARFIQTVLREWAYGVAYASSAQRTAALPAGCTTTIGIADTVP